MNLIAEELGRGGKQRDQTERQRSRKKVPLSNIEPDPIHRFLTFGIPFEFLKGYPHPHHGFTLPT